MTASVAAPGNLAGGRLAGRIALVTGASRGIGAAIARAYAKEGADLILTARTVGGLEELDDEIRAINGKSSLLVPFDLKDFDAIDRLGAALYERFGRLDVLVGNAGVLGTLSPLGHISPKEFQEVIDINLTANWRLVRSMDPLLRASPAGRAVFVSSGAAQGPRAYWGTYAISKAALEMMVGIYAQETQQTNVRANMIDPGRTRTRMRAKAYPGEDPQSVKLPDEIMAPFIDLATAAYTSSGNVVKAQ